MRRIKEKFFSYFGGVDISILFFLFFVFTFPFFKRFEILSYYSYLDGRFIDYLTYCLYGFDILFTLALIFWCWELLYKAKKIAIGDRRIFIAFFFLLLFSVLSLFSSQSFSISIYYIFILLYLLFLFLFIINKIKRKIDLLFIHIFFILSCLAQSVIAIIQFIKNGSAGIYILGEQVIGPQINGVAKIMWEGGKHIRSYGTFSHPNILALFLVVGGILIIHLFFQFRGLRYKIPLAFCFFIISTALILTFSRLAYMAALFSWAALFIYNWKSNKNFLNFKKIKNKKIFFILMPVLIVIFLGIIYYLFPAIWGRINPFLSSTWESWQVRNIVFLKSWEIIKENWLLGIGIGNFVINIAFELIGYPVWMAEPVHNTFILVLAELGVFGFLSFVLFIYFIGLNLKNVSCYLKLIFVVLVFYMFFDHCFWDLRQVQILLFLFFGLIVRESISKKSKKLNF